MAYHLPCSDCLLAPSRALGGYGGGEVKVEIFKTRKQLFLRVPTFRERFYFRLVGDNGEIVAQSEGYTQKHNVNEVVGRYFPGWPVKDLA